MSKRNVPKRFEVPPFERLAYFHGQMLTAADLRSEQAYTREKHKLHNRCLHGHGVVCGLEVEVELGDAGQEQAGAPPCGQDEPGQPGQDEPGQRERGQYGPGAGTSGRGQPTMGLQVTLQPGLAIDTHGNEIVVRKPLVARLRDLISDRDRGRVAAMQQDAGAAEPGAMCLYVSVRWREQPTAPVRPVLPEACGETTETAFARVRDEVEVQVTLDPPIEAAMDGGCEPCCSPPGDPAVLLAQVCFMPRGKPGPRLAVDNSVRRMLALYEPTRITSTSWVHGDSYTPEQAREILGTRKRDGGLELCFSRAVQAQSLRPGVIDIWVVEGGRGRRGGIWHMDGEYVGLAESGTVQSVRYRQTTGETLQDGDRVIVTVRGAFLRDACGQPVHGAPMGGPLSIPGVAPGSTTFESWFFVCEPTT